MGMDASSSTATFKMEYIESGWFGVAFSTGSPFQAMVGYSVIYTTGKNNIDPVSVYEYDLLGTGAFNVVKQGQQDLSVGPVTANNSRNLVEFSRAFSTGDSDDFVFTATETSFNLFAAGGGNGVSTLANHGTLSVSRQDYLLTPDPTTDGTYWCTADAVDDCIVLISTPSPTAADPTTAAPTTAAPTTSVPTTTAPTTTAAPLNITCDDRKDAEVFDSTMMISSVLCGDDNSIYIEITYPGYAGDWFGVVFSDTMIGDALVYTTGKVAEGRDLALWAYVNEDRVITEVVYVADKNWEEYFVDTSDGIHIIYRTQLSNTEFTLDTASIPIRYVLGALGAGTTLDYHSGGISVAKTLSFSSSTDSTATPTLAISTTEDAGPGDGALEIAHGVMLWVAWPLVICIASY
eukprot:CAMPEP_0197032826 /NCGR_PEP_ID=MMETSP1384-20130603/11393_1 /TAXON_ID=29189 /ORGANISM="Ammonia sp." /LENGTH=404 /DNA_ID=CAMNT_0042462533 /DNA_START=69 /DNA_END=1283 /DNA_ORIENTATION=+